MDGGVEIGRVVLGTMKSADIERGATWRPAGVCSAILVVAGRGAGDALDGQDAWAAFCPVCAARKVTVGAYPCGRAESPHGLSFRWPGDPAGVLRSDAVRG